MQHAAALSDGPRARTAYTNGEVGVLLFLATEVMLFAGLVSAVLVLRSADPAWSAGRAHVSGGAGAIGTALLAAGSIVLALALSRARRGEGGGALRGALVLSALAGAAFVALLAFEWRAQSAAGFDWRSGTFGSSFFVLTGLHGLHVLGGVVWCAVLALRPATRPGAAHAAKLASWYGFLVDGVWLALLGLFYVA